MKKITILFITLLIILNLPANIFAAEKTITTYTQDTNIQVSTGGGGGTGTGNCSSGTCTVTCPTGSVTCSGCTGTGICTCPCIAPFIPPSGTSFPPIVNDPGNPAITTDPATGAIVLGNGINNGSGAIWYGGTSPSGTCNPCTSGVCTFGLGFRVYFEFKITTQDSSANSNTYGDGFNFTIINSSNNRISYRGGSPNATFSMGELNGYAGPGNTATTSSAPHATPPALDGLGLQPPKMALEFDTYSNAGTSNAGCSGGRNDTANNHISLMFWGLNPASTTMCAAGSTAGNTFPQASFDDNIHGAGDGTTSNPYNSAFTGNGSGLGGYYERAKGSSTYNWLEDGQWHRVRIEVIRIPSTYSYEMKAWVDCEDTSYNSCPANEYNHFQDVFNQYIACTGTCTNFVCSNGTGTCVPTKIDRTQLLTAALNTTFNNILFGFTLGTGGATEGILINNFSIYFPTSTVGTPSNLSFSASGGSGTVSVTAVTGCTWTTSNNNNTWITFNPVSSTGSGSAQTETYTVAANYCALRTGTMTIAGQTFTVTQAAYTCPALSITTPTPANGINGQSYSTTVLASGGSGTLTYSLTGGTLPTGLTLNTSTGVISGTPTVAGTWSNIRVTITDNCCFGAQTAQTGNFSIKITCAALSITTPTPANGIKGQFYSTTVLASGGSGTLTYSLTGGTLPTGLTLNTSTGVISGTPTVAGIWSNIKVTVTDNCSPTAQTAQTGNFSIRIQFDPYLIYAGTGAPMYYISGSCQTLSSGSYYSLSYNNSVTFYRNSGCAGSTMNVTYSAADAADTDRDGTVQVNRTNNNWSLVDH